MNRSGAVVIMGLLALPIAAALPTAAASSALLDRMAVVDVHLQTFTASLHAHVAMRSFPFLTADLQGTYYYKRPDKNKVDFTSGVPMIAQQFDNLYAHIEPPARWSTLYVVSVVSDDGTTTAYRLVPRKHGNVSSIDATADDRSATVTTMRWNYVNGGSAEMTDRYGHVGGYLVVVSQTGYVHEPGYVAEIGTTIDDYRFNQNLPDAIFAGS